MVQNLDVRISPSLRQCPERLYLAVHVITGVMDDRMYATDGVLSRMFAAASVECAIR